MTERELILKIKSVFDGAGFDKVQSAASGFQDKMTDVSKGVAVGLLAGGVAVTAFGASSVSAAATFQAGMSNIQAVSGATAGEMEQVRAKAMQIGADTAFSAQQASMGIEELLKAGVDVKGVLGGAADAAIALASAGGVDLPTSAAIASAAMNNFGLSAQELPKVADLIAGAANASAISVEDFGYSLSASGAVANLAGFKFDDLAVAITAMGNAGIKGSDAGTSLKTFMSNLIPTTDKQIGLFKELGIVTEEGGNAFFDASGKARSMAEIADILQDAVGGMGEAQKMATLETMFGSDAIRAAAVIAGQGAEGMDNLAASMGKITAADVAKTRLDNLKGSVDAFWGSVETLQIKVGEKLLPTIRLLVDAGSQIVNAFGMFVDGDISKAADTMSAAFAGLGINIDPSKFTEVFTAVQEAIGRVQEAFSGIDSGGLADSIASIITRIADAIVFLVENPAIAKLGLIFTGLIAAFAPVMMVVGPLIPIFTGLFSVISMVVTPILGLISAAGGLAAILGTVATVLTGPVGIAILAIIGLFALWRAKGDEIKAAVSEFVTSVGASWEQFKADASAKWSEMTAAVGAAWAQFQTDISTKLSEIGTNISTKWDEFKAYIDTKLSEIGTSLLTKWTEFWTTISTKLTEISTAVTTKWDEVKTAIADALEEIAENLRLKWDAFLRQIAEKLDAILAKTTEAWELVKTTISDKLEEAKSVLTEKWEQARQIIDAAWQKIWSIIDDSLVRIKENIGSWLDWIADKTGVNLDNLKALWNSAMDTIRLAVAAVVAFLRGDWGQALDYAKQAAQTAWDGITGFFRQGWENIKRLLNVQELMDKFRGAKDRLMDAGRELVAGIREGIAGGWEALKRFLSDQIGDLIAFAKRLLGIASPSTVARDEIGVPFGQGVLGGIKIGLADAGKVIADGVRGRGGVLADVAIEMGSLIAGAIVTGVSRGLSGAGVRNLLGAVPFAPAGSLVAAGGITGAGMGMGTHGGFGGGMGTGTRHFGGNMAFTPSSGREIGDVVAHWNTTGRGGVLAASKSNYWQIFVQKWGVPTEASARKVAEKLGIPLPAWLEQIYSNSGGTGAGSGDHALSLLGMGAGGGGTGTRDLPSQFARLSDVVAQVTAGFTALAPAIAVATGTGAGAGGTGAHTLTPPPPPSTPTEPILPPMDVTAKSATIENVDLGDIVINFGETQINMDGREVARLVVKHVVEDVKLQDDLGKALGERAARRP